MCICDLETFWWSTFTAEVIFLLCANPDKWIVWKLFDFLPDQPVYLKIISKSQGLLTAPVVQAGVCRCGTVPTECNCKRINKS